MPYRNGPIELKDGCWIGACCFIGPNTTIGIDTVVTVGSIIVNDLESKKVVTHRSQNNNNKRWK